MTLDKLPNLYTAHIENPENLNIALFAGFQNHVDDENIKRTHFFGGRYENIYIGEDIIPEKTEVLNTAIQFAAQILNKSADELKAGLWFNAMGPGHSTTAHSHDDDDELLSAVYYVRTPLQSGNLIIRYNHFTTEVEPQEGMFVFFPANAIHEVTENKSNEMRLSLGINFGPK